MKLTTTHFCEYLKYSISFCIRTKIFFFILTLLEFMDIITNLIDQIIRIYFFDKKFTIDDNKLSYQILIISPYNYFFDFLSKSSEINKLLSINLYLIIIYFVLIIHLIIFFYALPKNDYHIVSNIEPNIYYKIILNFYDYIFHRPMSIYAFDIISREIMKLLFDKDYNIAKYILLFIFSFALLFIFIWHIVYINKINIWNNFISAESSINFYPFDHFFGTKYDLILLSIKFFIAVNKNYEYFNNNKVDYIVLFNIFLIFVIFYGYSLYLIYLYFLSYNCLYIFNNFYNCIRNYNILLIFELIPLRILLHNKNDFIIFYSFLVFFILFDLYLIIYSFSEFLFNKGIKCQNYLAIGFFIESNNIDRNSFITQWVINHKAECEEINCLICNELKNNENEFNNEEVEEKKSMTVINEEIGNKKIGNKNKINDNRLNIINKIFTPYKFNLKLLYLLEKCKNNLNYDDGIRYDFLFLTGLFLTNKNIDFLLYSELYLLMQKYQNNKNVVAIIRLIYNISRKSAQERIKNFELLKKNDDLLEYLRNFIQDYETFINYSSKSPANYLDMSKKFNNFKETVKNIHTIFKKNLERNYQLIILRFAYDSLLHQKFKNEQAFDFSIYNEFLSDRFEKDKIILIKYIIDKDAFMIVKCSKDFIKNEGKNLENIFPEFMKITSIEKLKNQLKSIDQNEYTQIFEFIIKSVNNQDKDSFIEAFRMEYFIYPTFKINEIFIFGKKYTIGYIDYIIYEHKKEGKDYIYSFSYRIYKYLGITPEMVSILRKIGVFIDAKKIFIQKQKDIDNLFILKYSEYYSYYENILSYDALLDLSNYNTIIERKKEIKNMAKEEKEIIFIISLKGEYPSNSGNLNLYSIREQLKKNDKRRKNSLKVKENTEDSDEISYEISGERENEFNGQSFNAPSADLASSLSSTSYKDSSQSPGGVKGKQNDKNDERKKSLKTINRFTLIILIFDIFLIILSIIFLILEVKEYNYFKKVFELFQTFKVFKRGVESSPLSLLSNYKFIDNYNLDTKTVISSMNIYEDYSIKLREKFTSLEKVPLVYKLIQKEISGKYDTIIESFNKYLSALFNINNDASKRVQNLLSFSFSLQKESSISLQLNYLNFISLCREYNNYISNLLLNDIYLTQNVSILNMAKETDINYKVETQYEFEFSSTIKSMLLLIFTYPSIHIGLAESSYFMQQEFHSSKNFMEKLLIIFFILFLSLHIVLIIICILFFIIYLRLLKINIHSTNKLFMDKKYIKFQLKRMELLKIINTLYSINPVVLFDKIKHLEDDYKKKTHQEKKPKNTEFKNILYAENNLNNSGEENKERNSLVSKSNKKIETLKNLMINDGDNENKKNKGETNNNEKVENNNNENNDEDDENAPLVMKNYTLSPGLFHKIIVIYKLILVYLFGCYFIYSIVFFIFVMFGINRLSNAITYCEVNSSIDELEYDNLNSMIFMYLTNSTPYFYNKLIYGNYSKNYIKIGINKLYTNLQSKENIEYLHSNLFPPLNQFKKLDCSDQYIQDVDFVKASTNLGISYDTYIKSLCEAFPVAKTNNDNNILYEILYMTEEFYRNYQSGSFDSILNNYIKNPLLCECFTLLLTYNKIIRTYFNEVIFPQEVYSIFRYFSTLIIAYLVVSVLFEIIFFVVLNITILQKIKYNNELMLDFIDSLKF